MALPAIADLRASRAGCDDRSRRRQLEPRSRRAIPGVDRVETLDARGWRAGGRSYGPVALLRAGARLAARRYDLAINFEPDIRTNLLLAAPAPRRPAGFASGGGGPLLDLALDYDPRAHTTDNAGGWSRAAFGGRAGTARRLRARGFPRPHREAAARLLARLAAGPLVGVHVSGGRAIKQWPEARFARCRRAADCATRGARSC